MEKCGLFVFALKQVHPHRDSTLWLKLRVQHYVCVWRSEQSINTHPKRALQLLDENLAHLGIISANPPYVWCRNNKNSIIHAEK